MVYANVIARSKTKVEELTYIVPARIIPYIRVGTRVMVPLRRRTVLAVVVSFSRLVSRDLRPKLKEITAITQDSSVFSSPQMRVIHELAQFYGCSLAEVAFHALNLKSVTSPSTEIQIASSQAVPKPIFIQGPWPDRRQNYKKLIDRLKKRNVLFIFAKKSFADNFLKMLIKLPEVKKQITIGTIGDIFQPLNKGDVIVVDEPHHLGARYNQRPFMSAYQIALQRAKTEGLQLFFGDTLVAIEDYPYVKNKNWQRVAGVVVKKSIFIADRRGSRGLLLPVIQERLVEAISQKRKVLVLVLSRGWASALICRSCGDIVSCTSCTRTTAVISEKLQCRYCGKSDLWPKHCSNCHGHDFTAVGEGVSQYLPLLEKLLPSTSIQQLSADNPILKPESQIIVATEKIFSYPDLKFGEVFILSVDRLITGSKIGGIGTLLAHLLELQAISEEISVQTYLPDHLIWSFVTSGNMTEYYQEGFNSRRKLHLPPFGSIITLVGQANKIETLNHQAEILTDKILQILPNIEISTPEIIDRSGRNYRAEIQLLLPNIVTNHQKLNLNKLLPPSWASII